VPLSTIARYENSLANDRVSHEGQFASEDISFDVAEGYSPDQALAAWSARWPGGFAGVIAKLAGTADAFTKTTQKSQPLMILGALVRCTWCWAFCMSYIHPLTILSTLPSAGVGALLRCTRPGGEFSLISLLGLFLLIGVVKKRHPDDRPGCSWSAITACRRRVDPPRLPAAPAADPDDHPGGDPRRVAAVAQPGRRRRNAPAAGPDHHRRPGLQPDAHPYTTPVVYLYLDRLRHRFNRWRGVRTDAALETPL
jgi:multidrug efflux pump